MKKTRYNTGPLLLLTLLLTLPTSGSAWQVYANPDNNSARTEAESVDGSTNLSFSCRDGVIYMVLFDYAGNAISRVDDSSMQIRLVFTKPDGSPLHTFTEAFHYFAPDQAHVLSETAGSPMADAWGAGSTMIFQSTSGEEVARFDLTDTSRARERFRQVCGV